MAAAATQKTPVHATPSAPTRTPTAALLPVVSAAEPVVVLDPLARDEEPDPLPDAEPLPLALASAEYSSELVNVWQLLDAGTRGWYGIVVIAPSDSGGCV